MIRQIFYVLRDLLTNLLSNFRFKKDYSKVTVNIPSNYILDDIFCVGDLVIDDVKNQLYTKLDEDKKLKKYCVKYKGVIANFMVTDKLEKSSFNIHRSFHYYDNKLFFANNKGYQEMIRLKKLERLADV